MKTILLIPLLGISLLQAVVPTKESINTLVSEIKPPRIGASQTQIGSIRNPFLFVKIIKDDKGKVTKIVSKVQRRSSRSSTRRSVRFKLNATLNKSAKINYRWIGLNRKISGYTLKKITKLYVTLQKGTAKPISVYLNRKNKKIHLLTK